MKIFPAAQRLCDIFLRLSRSLNFISAEQRNSHARTCDVSIFMSTLQIGSLFGGAVRRKIIDKKPLTAVSKRMLMKQANRLFGQIRGFVLTQNEHEDANSHVLQSLEVIEAFKVILLFYVSW